VLFAEEKVTLSTANVAGFAACCSLVRNIEVQWRVEE
jgi:hypothetical protein